MSGYIKRKDWVAAVLFGMLVTALPVQAASFDCAKAQSNIEHIICDNAEISKLDDELAVRYRLALRTMPWPQVDTVIQAQKIWMKARNDCLNAGCVTAIYSARIGMLPANNEVAPEFLSGVDKYVLVEQDPDQTGELIVDIEPDPEVCKLYEENLNYFAYQNVPMSCNRPIAPQFKDRIKEVEWEDLKPADYPELFRQLVLYMSGGRDKSPDDLKRHEATVATREYVFRRAKLELSGELQWEGPIYGLSHPQQYYSGKYYIVQYGSNSTDTQNPVEPCKPVRGNISLYDTERRWNDYARDLWMYKVNVSMDAVIGTLGGVMRGEQGEHMRLIDGKPFVEKNDFDASIYLLRLNSRHQDYLESLCKYQFNPPQTGR